MTSLRGIKPVSLNIIVPVYNEGIDLLPWLQELVGYLNPADRLVIVDASDCSDYSHIIKKSLTNLINKGAATREQLHCITSAKGRALQMNAGAHFLLSRSSSSHQDSLLWFLHSDSGLSTAHLSYLRLLKVHTLWGRFNVSLTPNIFPFGIISKFMNTRSYLTQVMTGDQGIFIRSDTFLQVEGYAEIPLMEDIEMSKRLRKLGRADCNGPALQTSARRWQQHGWLKTVVLMWQLRLMYWFGVSTDALVKKYYG